jgi:hypothetical protein
MRTKYLVRAAACAALFAASAPAGAEMQRQIVKTALCHDHSCKKGAAAYRPWELKLQVPAKLGQCTIYRTTPFLAVVLTRDVPDTAEADCGDLPKERAAKAGEAARQQAAASFRGRAVYSRMLCTGYGADVQYTVEGESGMLKNFMAVHAGNDRAAAERLLATAKARYPKAELASMTAYLETGDERCK